MSEQNDLALRSIIHRALARDGLLELHESMGVRPSDGDRLVMLAYDLEDVAAKLRQLGERHLAGDGVYLRTTLEAIDYFRLTALAKADELDGPAPLYAEEGK